MAGFQLVGHRTRMTFVEKAIDCSGNLFMAGIQTLKGFNNNSHGWQPMVDECRTFHRTLKGFNYDIGILIFGSGELVRWIEP